jgi:ubiquinone/menaquinone biosynthesis C-methylase UbiE
VTAIDVEENLVVARHRDMILDQFSHQALPFSAAAMINDKGALKVVVDAAQPGPKDTVLDVACGPGLVVCAFAPYSARVTGIDKPLRCLTARVSLRRSRACATSTGTRATYTYCRMPLRA